MNIIDTKKTRLVIFGTGSTALRALEGLKSLSEIELVAFCDNSTDRQGTKFENVPVLSADELLKNDWDLVLLASQFAVDIERQLLSLGIPKERILSPALNRMSDALLEYLEDRESRQSLILEEGEEVRFQDVPKILILTSETLNNGHGTGVLIQRYFSGYPKENLFSISSLGTGKPWLKRSVCIKDGTPRKIEAVLTEEGFEPNIVYATAINELDIFLLSSVLQVLPESVKVVQHFMDFMPHDETLFLNRLNPLLPRISEVWALTDSLSTALGGKIGRPVEHVSALFQNVSDLPRVESMGPGRLVMLGNVWNPKTVGFLESVWSYCKKEVPDLGPIDWYVHPNRIQSLVEMGVELGDAIHWKGFSTGELLLSRLARYDAALIGFNFDAKAEDGYARYSLPSRLTEISMAGLPLFAVASPDTELARFVGEEKVGAVASGPNPIEVGKKLSGFLSDRKGLEEAGRKTRALAETRFDLRQFRPRFLRRIISMAL
ncbi:hypothetical protein [Pelagicoccus sp. SDUM812002]|uniref:hypothetical protein n=1 Tax=Pelagicoccus sp. SDUM812002 TaxID=3041266 RepID=UPI0028106DC1|nr:hypothetical protein [Pelagicoccus sp. SDUM812002]MDQ8186437.1 hypothetical protein [Pelagicoccus sp. SDUM812002]